MKRSGLGRKIRALSQRRQMVGDSEEEDDADDETVGGAGPGDRVEEAGMVMAAGANAPPMVAVIRPFIATRPMAEGRHAQSCRREVRPGWR